LKIHSTKSHKVDGDGFAVVVSGVTNVSRSNAVTSHTSHSQFNAMPATKVFCCAVCEQPFSTQQALSLHYFRKYEVRSMKDVKKLECRKNASSTVSGSQSGSNVPAHLPQSRIECDVCGRYFYTTASFKMHSIWSNKSAVKPSLHLVVVLYLSGGYNYDSTSIRRPFVCLLKVIKVTVM